MDNLAIRPVDISHLDEVYSVIHECAEWMQQEQHNPDWLNYYDTPDKLRAKFEHGKVFVLYIGKQPVATISLTTEPPTYYLENNDGKDGAAVNYVAKFSDPQNPRVLYRGAMAVRPDFQGQKLASKLIAMTEDYARQNGYEFIRMDTRNAHLLDFYKRQGYQIAGEMPDGETIYYLVEKDMKKK